MIDFNFFIWGLRKTITIGNGNSSIYLTPGEIKTYRATDEIIIQGDFYVPLGSELNLIPTICH